MTKRKATIEFGPEAKIPNTSTDFVFYKSYRKDKKIRKISAAKIGKRPIDRFFLDHNHQYFPL